MTYQNEESSIKNQEMAHEQDNRYRCEICGKMFNVQHRLDVHSLSHINENNFKRAFCKNVFLHISHSNTCFPV